MMKKLLLADDSITIQKVVGIIFAAEDYQLVVADDGDSAFSKALEEIPDLVIADISMPGKDGFELCRAIKSEPSLANTPVLLLPGVFDHFDEIKAQEVCADGWLTKPFESKALLDKVSQLLEAEPVRMGGVAEPAIAEPVEESPVQAVDFSADQPIDEIALGFDEMDDLTVSMEGFDEESSDDIWDAVSFEEEDLHGAVEGTSGQTVSLVADIQENEPFDLVDEGVAGSVSGAVETGETGSLELRADDLVEQNSRDEAVASFAESVATELSEADDIIDLSEDEIVADDIKATDVETVSLTEEEIGLVGEPDAQPELLEDEEEYIVATTETGFTDEVADSSIEQVEKQLRGLSETELREIVAKVAGPMIEKLAGEMLEQIAWDVVPDLAEAMIGEEIRKIKQGTE